MKLGYHTSFLKNLLLRIEKAAKGTVRVIDENDRTCLDISIIFDFGAYSRNLSQIFNGSLSQCHWYTIAEDKSHSCNLRYISILNYIVKSALDTKSFLPTVLGFTFSSIEELDLKLTINGY